MATFKNKAQLFLYLVELDFCNKLHCFYHRMLCHSLVPSELLFVNINRE